MGGREHRLSPASRTENARNARNARDTEFRSQWPMGPLGYPLVNIQKAIEHGPFIVDLPIKNGDFP